MIKAHYYGHTRFSVHLPGNRAWRVSRQAGEYTDILFDSERMALRSDIFLNLALPIYQSWAERFRYRHIVHFSSDLPDTWRSRLEQAASRHSCLILDEVGTQILVDRVIAADLRDSDADRDLVVRIRVDDDDLLAADYLDRLDGYVSAQHVGFAVSFGLGVAALYRDGVHRQFRIKREILPSAGQAYIGRFDPSSTSVQGVEDAPHNRIDTVAPVIFDSREPMYLQTYHSAQDKELGRDADPISRLRGHSQQPESALLSAKFPTLRLQGGDPPQAEPD